MKLSKYFTGVIATALLLFVAVGCADLAVDNLNEPDTEAVLAEPSDVRSLPAGGFSTWFLASTDLYPWMGLQTMGDQFASSWGNFGMNDLSSVPRTSYNNALTAAGDVRAVAENPWYNYYSSVATANDVLIRIEDGVAFASEAETRMVEASSLLLQALSHGYLGIVYDQAYILDEATQRAVIEQEIEPTGVELSSYQDVVQFAVTRLEQAVQVAEEAESLNPGITMPASYISGYAMTVDEFRQLANSFAARFLMYEARTASENEAADWNRILNFADNGLTFDFAPVADGGINWYDYVKLYGNESGWIRVAQRVLHMVDSTQPETYPDFTNQIEPVETDDERFGEDGYFQYVESIPFDPGRGYFHFSHYTRVRSPHNWSSAWDEALHLFIEAENDLIRAEAIVRTGGSHADAANLINNSRVGQGGLEPLSGDESTEELLDAIYYERFLEIDYMGPGQGYMDRRRFGDLQPGTPLHLPMPASELNLLEMEIYTFGGDAGGAALEIWALPGAKRSLSQGLTRHDER